MYLKKKRYYDVYKIEKLKSFKRKKKSLTKINENEKKTSQKRDTNKIKVRSLNILYVKRKLFVKSLNVEIIFLKVSTT